MNRRCWRGGNRNRRRRRDRRGRRDGLGDPKITSQAQAQKKDEEKNQASHPTIFHRGGHVVKGQVTIRSPAW